MLDGAAPVVVSSQLLNRQDGEDEYHVAGRARRAARPAQARASSTTACSCRACTASERRRGRARLPLREQRDDAGLRLPPPRRDVGRRTTSRRPVGADLAKTVFTATAAAPARRSASSSSSRTTRRPACPPRSSPTAATARSTGPIDDGAGDDRSPSSGRGSTSSGTPATSSCAATSRASRRCAGTCSSSPRRSAQTQEQGIAAKGVTGGGYEGHYFWDTEIYVVPFLAYTSPDTARKLLRFRWRMLPTGPAAGGRAQPGRRAVPVAHDQRRGGVGVLRRRHRPVPHQRGDRLRPQALPRRHAATSTSSPARAPRSSSRRHGCGRTSASTPPTATRSFHIHGVTGPDEYTTVVNDNLYTNVMARFNMRYAARVVELAARSGTATPTTASRRRVELEPTRSSGGPGRRRDVPPLRRGARHPPAGRHVPRARAVGLRAARRPTTTRCCSTTTRS